MSAFIILVEDRDHEADLIIRRFRQLRYPMLRECDAQSAILRIKETNPALVILDIVLAADDDGGFKVLDAMQQDSRLQHIPVLVYSGLGSEPDIVERGLDLDAMWIVAKERGIRELSHYVHRALRIYEDRYAVDPKKVTLYYDSVIPELWIDGERKAIHLTPQAHRLLKFLFQWQNHLCTRDDIANVVWAEETRMGNPPYDHAINRAVDRLRDTLAVLAPHRKFIESAWGHGYKLCVEPLD